MGKMTTRGWVVLAGLLVIIVVGLTGDRQMQGWSMILLIVGVYFIPWYVAAVRNVPNRGSVAVINLLLGWTLVGWVVALAMAARDPKQ